jgi:hypothetical protein
MDDAGNVYEMRNKITGEIISANTAAPAAPAASDRMQELINAQMQEGYQPPPMPVLPPETNIFGDAKDKLGNFYDKITGTPSEVENLATEQAARIKAAAARGITAEQLKNPVYMRNVNTQTVAAINKAGEEAVKKAQPGFIREYGPLAAAGAGVAYLGGAFDVPEMEKPNILPSGFGQQGVDPELVSKYRLSEGSLNTTPTRTSPISARVAPRRQSDILRRRFPDVFAARDGGEVFPRRTGGIMPDEGVPGKDSVRAMVMPGEFIFTTDAVRGASPTGNLNDGINNMYSVMRKLESRGKRMA